jgi:hypothetical protein
MTCREKTKISVHIVGMGINLNGLPNSAIHISDFNIVKENAVSRIDAVFSYG